MTVIADTAIPIFERIAEEAKLKEGESVSTDTYTLVLTNDEMNDIINAHADLKEYLRKHADKMNKDSHDFLTDPPSGRVGNFFRTRETGQ